MLLVDTQVVLWAVADDPKLGPNARGTIATAQVRYVSAVSHAELTIKTMRGKLRVSADFPSLLAATGFTPLPLDERHVVGMREFEDLSRHDPFDRLLIAQARVDGLRFLTSDRVLLALGHPWIIDATL